MIILRLLSLIFTLSGLAVLVTAVWLLMGNELTIPDSGVFGEQPEAVTQELAEVPAPPAQAAARSVMPPADEMFTAQTMPSVAAPPEPTVFDTMRTVPIAYEAPERAQFARAFEVTVVVDATGDDTAADALDGTGQVIEGKAQVTDRVRVSVTGAAFDLEGQSPEIQVLSPMTENIWRWKATARQAGEQDLAVEIFALDGDDALPVRTYRGKISIEVTRLGQAIQLAQDANPIAMLLGGVGSALAGFFGFVGFFRKRR